MLVEVDSGGELLVSLEAEVSHTALSEIPGMATRKKVRLLSINMARARPHCYGSPQAVLRRLKRLLLSLILTICSC